jgi:hypothetical protein
MPRFFHAGCHTTISTLCEAFSFAALKTTTMKLPKSLLAAVVIGIAVQTATSCSKDKGLQKAKAKQEEKKKAENKYPYNCPACGMG